MEIESLRTFLAIAETGSFATAATRLNVTQSTVSARIKAMEDQLGQRLFERGRAGARTTAAGQRLMWYASMITRGWQQARQELALPEGVSGSLTIGSQYSLWDSFLVLWLAELRWELTDVAIACDVAAADQLVRGVADGLIDIAILYTPQTRAGLISEQIFEDRLVAVATRHAQAIDPTGYVYCDWGPEFAAHHADVLPGLARPAVTFTIGAVGLQYLTVNGGWGYFPLRLVEAQIKRGRLHPVADAPSFDRPVFVLYPRDADPDSLVARTRRNLGRFLGERARHAEPM